MKSKNIFLVADTHFGHKGVCQFMRSDGVTKLRPWDDPDEMDEAMVTLWNERVGPTDKIYHLGDVVINRRALKILPRLNGDKILIKGNHDIFRLNEYAEHFRDIRGYHVMNGLILSHIPVHSDSLGRFGTCVHGHLHSNRVMREVDRGHFNDDDIYNPGKWVPNIVSEIDPRYFCVSVEHTGFAPMHLDEVQKLIVEQGGHVGFKNGNGPTM